VSARVTPVNPETLARPRGYSHGTMGNGDVLFVAGQVGWDRNGHLVSPDFVAQFAQALDNVLEVVWKAGGEPASVARLVLYVTDKAEYVRHQKAIGEAYRARMGKHFPAMALIEVKGLLEEGAKIEIEATAIV
jgi:enamine deaminase RidA (YjgF/YER057c/UK114 family)